MRNNNKVGIITFHNAENFGAVLQAWALSQVIRNMGCQVSVIDYVPAGRIEKNRRFGLKGLLPSPGRILMQKFRRNFLSLTRRLNNSQKVREHMISECYDCLVCGSDQVWQFDRFLGFDPIYYLDVDVGSITRRIAYAPSCGIMNDFGEYADQARRLLERFDALSVRDKNSQKLLEGLGITGIPIVVDPTLLADFTPFSGESTSLSQYLAIVGPMTQQAGEYARQLSDRMGLRLVAVGTRCKQADVEKRFVGPQQWLKYIAGARMVITSLFHGAAISIRLRKPFVALDAAGRTFKLIDLLSRFQLNDRLLKCHGDGMYDASRDLLELDYSRVEPIIEAETEASMRYLRESLNV